MPQRGKVVVKKMSKKALKELVDSVGGVEELHKSFERHRKDVEYFDAHRKDLLKAYPEEWVAILNEKVVAHDKDFLGLLAQLDEKVRTDSVIQHVTAKKMHWILAEA